MTAAIISPSAVLLTPPSLRPAARPRPCCLSICSTTAAASVWASGSICRPRLAQKCKRCRPPLDQRLNRHGLHLDQRLDDRRPRLASSLRQRCSCPTGGSTRRRHRLDQRLDDRSHHLSVSGATYTTFASAGGSTAPPSPHQQLSPAASVSANRPRFAQRRERCCLCLGQRLDRALVASQSAQQPPPPPSRPVARSAVLASPRSANAATFLSTSGSTATASILTSGSTTAALVLHHLSLGVVAPLAARHDAASVLTSSSMTAAIISPSRISGATYTTFASASGSTAPLLPHNLLKPRRLDRLGQRLDNRQVRCDCHHLCYMYGQRLNRPAVASPAARLPPSPSWPAYGQRLDHRSPRLTQQPPSSRPAARPPPPPSWPAAR